MNDWQIGHLYSGLYALDKTAERDGLFSWKDLVKQVHDDTYNIRGRKDNTYTVNLKKQTCSCAAATNCWHISAIEVYCTGVYPPKTEESIRITNSDIDVLTGKTLHKMYVISGDKRIPVGNYALSLLEWRKVIKKFENKEIAFVPETNETRDLLRKRNSETFS